MSPSWFLNGPPLSYFPLPTKDPLRSFGQDNCSKCPSKCTGHYLKSNLLIDAAIKGQELPPLQPPSDVILSVYKKYKAIPSDTVIETTSEDVLLPMDETKMWFEHLHQVSLNRQKGAKKASSTRLQQKNKNKQPACEDSTEDPNKNVCAFCGKEEPPQREQNCMLTDVSWVACDGCLTWFHVECSGLRECEDISALNWLCLNCKQSWDPNILC